MEGLVRRLQGHMVSGGCYSLAMAKRGKLFWQILLLLSWLLSEGFPHKLGVESLGADESKLLCLGSFLGKNSNSRSPKKEGLEPFK